MNDTLQTAQLSYNLIGPQTAIGTALDVNVGYNGLIREAASYSTVTLTLTGVAYTVITNGLASDINGNTWALPASVTSAPVALSRQQQLVLQAGRLQPYRVRFRISRLELMAGRVLRTFMR